MTVVEGPDAGALPAELEGEPGLGRGARGGAWRWLARAYGGLLALVVLAIVAAPWLPVPDPNAQDLRNVLQPPVWAGGTSDHLFGTDQLGRDQLSRLLHGGRLSFLIVGLATLVGAVLGTTMGLVAGYLRGLADAVVSRLVDAQLALPFVLLAMAVVGARGRSVGVLVLVLSTVAWPQFARLVRAEALTLRGLPFILALRTSGVSPSGMLARHLLPNVLPLVGVVAALQFGILLLVEGALSFLGLGVTAPDVTWGLMLSGGRDYLRSNWWVVVLPGLAITLTVFHVNILGDLARQRLDPTLRNRAR